MSDPLAFVLSVALVLMMPGPTNTLLAASGALVGLRRSAPLLAAELCGYLTSVLTLRLVLGAWIAAVPAAAAALRVAAGLYLVAVALRTWRGRGSAAGNPSFGAVLATTLLNPKALIFALVLFPMRGNVVPYIAAFSVVVPIIGSAWIAFGTLTRRTVGGNYVSLIPRITSLALAGFGAVLIVRALVR
jgi:threonine/homoserine/homoserine lactone efflux protein